MHAVAAASADPDEANQEDDASQGDEASPGQEAPAWDEANPWQEAPASYSFEVEDDDPGPGELWLQGEAAGVLRMLRCAVCLGIVDRCVTAPCMHRFCQVRKIGCQTCTDGTHRSLYSPHSVRCCHAALLEPDADCPPRLE